VAIVFGAGLRRDGTPTTVLADRVAAAVDLYRAGTVSQVLLSGAGSDPRGSEPVAMRRLALELGLPENAILLDQGGTRTFTTCQRARAVFGIRQATLVTQRYHLPRALALCHAIGLQAVGTAADRHDYGRRAMSVWNWRETPATAATLLEAYILRPHLSATAVDTPRCMEEPRDGT
jgi:vancomycin permeability regulator SanA